MDVKEIIRYLFSLRNGSMRINYLVLSLSLLCVVNVRTCSANSIQKNDSVSVSVDSLQTANVSYVSGLRPRRIGDGLLVIMKSAADHLHRLIDDSAGTEVARTFGRPLRKLQSALLPIMFKLGVMSTLIFLTFLLVLKGVGVGLLLLMFKVGAAFAKFKSEWHGHHPGHGHHDGWYPPHKEVHLHVVGHPGHGHGYGYGYEPSISAGHHDPWSRSEYNTAPGYNKISYPYGQQFQGSINTPYGHYVRTGDPTAPSV